MRPGGTMKFNIRLFKREGGIYYAELNRTKKVSLRTDDLEQAEIRCHALALEYLKQLIVKMEESPPRYSTPKAPRVLRPRPSGHIYFLQSESHGLVKIGYATDPEKRINGLRTAGPDKLKVLAIIKGTMKQEKALHEKFAPDRLHV